MPSRCARSPATRRSPSFPTTWPATRISPEVGRSSAAIRCSSVDLPDPDGPTIASSSPWSTLRVTPRTGSTGGMPG
jgi:hypothetical protein